jgi:hypothetical protein
MKDYRLARDGRHGEVFVPQLAWTLTSTIRSSALTTSR